MTDRSPMHQQIDTLPTLIRDIVKPFDASARRAFDFETCASVKRHLFGRLRRQPSCAGGR